MKRKPLLSLTVNINSALRKKLEANNMLKIAFELRNGKCLIETIKKEEVIRLRVIRHDNEEGDDPMEDFVDLEI